MQLIAINRFHSACPQNRNSLKKGYQIKLKICQISCILFVLYHKMPVRTAGALVFLLLMIEQHNTFSFWNGYQINPKICQNILYSHCFMSQNTCFSFLNSGTAHHFLFLPKEQHTTFSFCQNHGWSILNQSFARFMIGKNQ